MPTNLEIAKQNSAPLPAVKDSLRPAIAEMLDLLFDTEIRRWLARDNDYGYSLCSLSNQHQSSHLLQSARHPVDACRAWRYTGQIWHDLGGSKPIRLGQIANACAGAGRKFPSDKRSARRALKLLTDYRCGLYVIDTDRHSDDVCRFLASQQREFFNRVYGEPSTRRPGGTP